MKNILKFKTVLFFAVLLFSFAFFVSAANPFDIKFPVQELENCASLDQCKVYCDDASHTDACIAFGQKYGLTDKNQAEQARALKNGGPGNCQTGETCKTYCADQSHINECLNFAEKHGLDEDVKVHIIPLGGKFKVGSFELEFVNVTHSIPPISEAAVLSR